ncbi:MAG TPA: DUF4249 domain-containing protein [Chitinophagaceae bacterium]|nr:DUF4249 domain-containing protein [Chitinophagaceae bacterium]
MRKFYIISFLTLLSLNCRKPYAPPLSEVSNTMLVVEGMIAVGDSAENRFLLSRLKPLDDTTLNDPEVRARITVESSAGGEWVIPEVSPGVYSAVNNIPVNADYRLRIAATNGKVYETPFLKPVNTPPIDSVTWLEPEDINIYVHAYDPTNTTKYYRWEYTETWEYRSFFESFIKFDGTYFQERQANEMVYSCYRYGASNTIILNNTTALAEDRISYQLLKTIPNGAEEVSQRYSIQVKQYGLTKEAYEFWNILRKNTELTGSLFDPQPSQLPGNIVCINTPGEKVIGYVCAGKQQLKRMFIRRGDLTINWPKEDESLLCVEFKSDSTTVKDTLRINNNLLPAYFITGGGVSVADKRCVDCREKGGTNVKPSFW